ncbi:MAG TPA: hypothetical protein VJS20_11595 [Gemmatimonadales bacterium]|nr:hypothetical protein [Gemmatimonadales bacterium]
MTAPSVADWSATRNELDGATTETVVETPVAPPAEVPPAATPDPAAETPPAPAAPPAPSPADQIVQGLVKSGMTDQDAKALLGKATTPEPIKDALEAYLDGKPYQVPKGLTFKLKSGQVVTEKSLDALHKEGMLYHDYQNRTQVLSRQERELQGRIAKADAQLAAAKAREEWVREQEAGMLEAQKDPKKWEAWQQYQHQYQTNPMFRKMADDALAKRETDAELGVYRQQEDARIVDGGVQWAMSAITTLGKEFPGVDPDRVRERYGALVANGQADLTFQDLRGVFEYEKAYVDKTSAPINAALEQMRAELDALKAGKAAETHNATTAHALERAKAINTAPGGGGPPAPARAPERKPIPPTRQAHEDAVRDWASRRD